MLDWRMTQQTPSGHAHADSNATGVGHVKTRPICSYHAGLLMAYLGPLIFHRKRGLVSLVFAPRQI